MENFENWNKKVRKKNLDDSLNLKENENLSQRDYDKDPIIIKDYHQIFNSILSLFSALVAFMILLNIYVYIFGYLIYRPNDGVIKEFGKHINLVNLIIILILVIDFMITYYIFAIHRKAEIHFTNKFIRFYEFGKLQYSSANGNLRDIICKPFWLEDREGNGGILLSIFVNQIIALAFFKAIGIFFIVCYFFANIFLKACFHLIIKRNLKDFTPFFSIIVDEPQRNGWAYNINVLRGKFYMVCIFDKKDYLEIKQWFLDKKNINIDYIEKTYFKR